MKKLINHLDSLAWKLYRYFSAELSEQEVKAVIEDCRILSDIKSLVSKIYEKGAILVGFEEVKFPTEYWVRSTEINFLPVHYET